MLITEDNIREFKNIKECDCISMDSCERHSHWVTYYPGTILEKSIDVGLCAGRCNNRQRCIPNEYDTDTIVSLYESQIEISIIKSCKCGKLSWNGNAALIRE